MQYNYRSVELETVAENIDEYIIPECQRACQCFWDNNIITSMCSNYDNGDNKWITLGQLSDENKAIFKRLMKEDPEHYSWNSYYNKYQITDSGTGEEVSERLVKLAQALNMQDVLDNSGQAYVSIKVFLMDKFGLSKTVPNPDYQEEEQPKYEDFESISDFFAALDEWANKGMQPKTMEVFDESQMTKSVEEYIADAEATDLYDAERGVVYTSQFYKDMHERYMEYMRNRQREAEVKENQSTRKSPNFDDGDGVR